MTNWLARQLKFHRSRSRRPFAVAEVNGDGMHLAAEAVDPDFADALTGEATPRRWNAPESKAIPARWRPEAMTPRAGTRVEVVLRRAAAAPV